MTAHAAVPPDLSPPEADAIAHGRHGDPFKVLGPRDAAEGRVIRAFLPGAQAVERAESQRPCRDRHARGPATRRHVRRHGRRSQLHICCASRGRARCRRPRIPIPSGRCWAISTCICSTRAAISNWPKCSARMPWRSKGSKVWVSRSGRPTPSRVAVIGDFNSWDARRHPMRLRFPAGVWELFVPRLKPGARYKFDIVGAGGVPQPHKADPVAQADRGAAGHGLDRRHIAGRFAGPTTGLDRRPCGAPGAAGAALDLRGPYRLVAAARRAARSLWTTSA